MRHFLFTYSQLTLYYRLQQIYDLLQFQSQILFKLNKNNIESEEESTKTIKQKSSYFERNSRLSNHVQTNIYNTKRTGRIIYDWSPLEKRIGNIPDQNCSSTSNISWASFPLLINFPGLCRWWTSLDKLIMLSSIFLVIFFAVQNLHEKTIENLPNKFVFFRQHEILPFLENVSKNYYNYSTIAMLQYTKSITWKNQVFKVKYPSHAYCKTAFYFSSQWTSL